MQIEKQILSILMNLADERQAFFTDHRVLNLNGHSHELFEQKELQAVYSTIKELFHDIAAVSKHSIIGRNPRLNKSLIEEIDNEPIISGQIQTLLDILIENYRRRKIKDIVFQGCMEEKAEKQFEHILSELHKLKSKTTKSLLPDFVDKSMDWVEGLQTKTSWRMITGLYVPELRELIYAFGGALYAGMYGFEGLRQSTKTMLCINLMLSAAQSIEKNGEGGKVLFYSLDDSFDQFMVKCVSIITGLSRNIFLKVLDKEKLQRVCDCVMNSISILPFEVITRKDLFPNGERITFSKVDEHIRRKAKNEKIDLICLDYVQKFKTDKMYPNKLELYEAICDGARAIQEDLDCAFFLLSQQTQMKDETTMQKKIDSSVNSDSQSRGNRGFPDACDVHLKMMNLSKIQVNNEQLQQHKIRVSIVKNKITGIDDAVVNLNFNKEVCRYE